MTKKITRGGIDEGGSSQHTRSKGKWKATNPTPKKSIHFSSDQKNEIRRIVNEEIAKAMPIIIAAVRNANNKTGDNEGSNMKKKCRYKDFLACKPDTFNGENGAIEAYNWLERMEAILDISDCDEKDKVRFAAHSFESIAFFWWGLILQTRGKDVVYEMSWNEFKELVLKQFCPYSEEKKIRSDLINLKMIGLDCMNYTLKFNELSRLVPFMVTPETEKISRYIDGLPPEIQQYMAIGNHMTFQSAVDMAKKLTDSAVRQRNENYSLKRKWDEGNENEIQGNHSGCRICGKMHSDRCWFEGTTCRICKNIGHTNYNCPANESSCYAMKQESLH